MNDRETDGCRFSDVKGGSTDQLCRNEKDEDSKDDSD